MIIDPNKFTAIILHRTKSNFTNVPFTTTDNQTIKTVLRAKLLGILLDDKSDFNLHISNISTFAAMSTLTKNKF